MKHADATAHATRDPRAMIDRDAATGPKRNIDTRTPATSRRIDLIGTAGILGTILGGVATATPGVDSRDLDPPAAPGAYAVQTTPDGDGIITSWIEAGSSPGMVAIRFSRLSSDPDDSTSLAWSPAQTMIASDDLFANWADRPAIQRGTDGALIGHRLRKIGTGTYAYGVMLSRSEDEGRTWSDTGWLHDDDKAVEHGFVSAVPTREGLRYVWLDGRQMTPGSGHDGHGDGHGDGGAMSLRTAVLDAGSDSKTITSTALDARVCECCDTDLAMTGEGPVAVYRDRGPNEERDIFIVRETEEGWTTPMPVARDGWVFPACPVNGPSVSASGAEVVVAWFTAAGDEGPRVLASRSGDHGRTFSPPTTVARSTIGRTDVLMLPEGDALVLWMDRREPAAGGFAAPVDARDDSGSVALRRLSRDGVLGPATLVESMDLGRRAGFPRLELLPADEAGGRDAKVILVWRDEEGDRLRGRAVDLDDLD